MITSEPLVEVAVQQFRETAREGFLFAVPPGAVASGSGEEASKKNKLFSRGILRLVSEARSTHSPSMKSSAVSSEK
jgi:hypothetical protein